MHNNEFEQAFGDFLDRRAYDEAENALFAIARAAFEAGWLAAGGMPLQAQPVLEVVGSEQKEKARQ